jgi:DNA-binding XRE family transcriptional regulator
MAKQIEKLSEEFLKERLKDPGYKEFYVEEQFRKTLASAIIEIRKKRKLTQKQLAERANLPAETIARLEAAEYKKITLKLLYKLALATDTTIDIDFVIGSKPIQKPSNKT